MAIFYPDILEHNNPNYALVSYSQLRGNAYAIDTLNNTGSIPSDKRSTGQIIFTSASGKFYAFIAQNTANWNTASNWKEIATTDMLGGGGGGSGGNTFATMSIFNGTSTTFILSDSPSASLFISTSNQNLTITPSAGTDTITFGFSSTPTFTAVNTANLTASSLPNVSQPNIIGYDTASGRFTYFSTASLTSSFVGGNGTTNYITRWSGPNTITTSSMYESSSRIGIGTTTPTTTLDVAGSINATGFVASANVFTNLVRGYLTASFGAPGIDFPTTAVVHISGASNDNLLRVSSPTDQNILFVSGSGNVGIGTTSSLARLHVNPTTSTPNLITSLFTIGQSDNGFKAGFANGAGSTTGSEHAKVGMWFNPTVNSTANPVTHIGFIRGNSGDGSGITFNINNTETMRISGSNVGIGTTSPTAKLHIYTNQSPHIGLFSRVENTSSATIPSASSIQTKIDSTSGTITNAYNINILNSSASEGTPISNLYGVHINLLNSGSNNWAIFTSGSTRSYFGGNVGLNVTAPTYRLQVKGNNDTDSLLKVEGSTNTFIDVTNGNVLVSGSNVHLSGSLYFSASSAGNVSNSVLVRDNTTGQIKLTGSYGGGGGGGVTLPSNLLSGSGTPTYIALYSGSNFLSSSNIFQNSSSFIGIGTTTPSTLLQVGGRFSADLALSTQPQVVVFNSSTKELTYMSTSSLVAGAGGTPGGINFDIQYNSNSTFGGTGAPQTFFYNYNNGGFGQGDGVSPSGSHSHTHGFYTITEDGAFYSHAEGSGSIVKAEGSAGHAEGQDTIVRGIAGHAEGYKTYVGIIDVFPWAKSGSYAHAEGYYTTASGQAAHSEGYFSWAAGDYSHAEGRNTRAYGDYSHAEGRNTATSASYAHSEGFGSIASASYSHAEGINTIAEGEYSHAEGNGTRTTSNGGSSHAEGASTISDGPYSHAEGQLTITYGSYSHAEGYNSTALANYSHAEGASTNARAEHSHTEGLSTETKGQYSHAEGYFTLASGSYSHAEGYLTIASGSYSHAEGEDTDANAVGSHTEGYLTKTNGAYSHAEGESTNAIGIASHTEGYLTTASGQYSHAEGESTQAIGYASHTIGVQTKAVGTGSFTAGLGTVASGSYQNVIGKYNISSSAETASFIIGNGFSDTNRSNLLFAFGSQVQITGSLLVSGSIAATNISGNFLQDRIISPVNAGPGEQTIAQVISGSSDDTIFKLIPSGLTIGSSSVIYSRYPLYTINGEPFDIGWGIGAPPSYSLDVYGESNFGGSNPYEGSRNNNNIRPKSYGFSHGQSNQVTGSHSFTQGKNLIASSSFQHIVGSYNQQINKDYSFVIGNGMPDDRSNILLAHGGPVLSTTPEVQITGSFSVTHNPNYNNSSPFADVRFNFLSSSYQNNVLMYDTASGQIFCWTSSLQPPTYVPPTTVSLEGSIKYNNTEQTPMTNTTVHLINDAGNSVYSTTTSTTGQFGFSNVIVGNYYIKFSHNKPWGSVTSTDSLLVTRYFNSLTTLTGLRLRAADVNNSQAINSGDALLINKRITGAISSFIAGDWVYGTGSGAAFNAYPGPFTNGGPYITHQYGLPLTASTNIGNLEYIALCMGDVNGSYVPNTNI